MERHRISHPPGSQQCQTFLGSSSSLAHPNTPSSRKTSTKVWSRIPSWRSIVFRIDVGGKTDSFLLISGEFQAGIDSTMRTRKTSSKDTARAQNNGCFTVSGVPSLCGGLIVNCNLGCKSDSIEAIINDCFNRSHATRCGQSLLPFPWMTLNVFRLLIISLAAGQGIYFATQAATSLTYTHPNSDGVRHMFMGTYSMAWPSDRHSVFCSFCSSCASRKDNYWQSCNACMSTGFRHNWHECRLRHLSRCPSLRRISNCLPIG